MKTKKIITLIITVLAVAMVVFSGLMKLAGKKDVVEVLINLGVGKYRIFLGLAEVVFAVLFVLPKTMKIGFILLSCYFAGAMATELSHGTDLNALTPIVLVWVAAFLRDKSLFLPSGNKA